MAMRSMFKSGVLVILVLMFLFQPQLTTLAGESVNPLVEPYEITEYTELTDNEIIINQSDLTDINILHKKIDKLNIIDRYIITRRYGIDCKQKTLLMLSKELNLSVSYIKKLENKIINSITLY